VSSCEVPRTVMSTPACIARMIAWSSSSVFAQACSPCVKSCHSRLPIFICTVLPDLKV